MKLLHRVCGNEVEAEYGETCPVCGSGELRRDTTDLVAVSGGKKKPEGFLANGVQAPYATSLGEREVPAGVKNLQDESEVSTDEPGPEGLQVEPAVDDEGHPIEYIPDAHRRTGRRSR